ncbi:MAG: Asp-tRNA(Asn)/Glu-tRNA(Gln) amidotransferase subunit GatC [Acidimicrobiales bacterium]
MNPPTGGSPEGDRAPIGRDDVAHVARLARLSLTDDELDRFTGQLATVLAHAADIAALDLDGVVPTNHPLPVRNVVRTDEPRPGLERDEVLAGAPDVEDNRFRVPRIGGEAP